MRRDPRKFLTDMLDRALFLSRFLADKTLEDLESDRILRSATEREFMVLGEAMSQKHHIAPEIAEQIDRWDDIIGFRHILVHGYDVLEMPVVWDVIKSDLPPLITQLVSMLSEQS